MNRMVWAWFLIVAVVLSGSIYLGRADADDKRPRRSRSRAFKPATEIEHLMEGQQFLFGGIRKSLQQNKWDAAVTQAWILAELGNVNVHNGNDPEYAKLAGKMSKAAVAMAETFDKEDMTKAHQAMKAVGASCKSCHDQFRK